MAVRIHVTASLADREAVQNAFRDALGMAFDNISIESTPPWNFFTTSVWGVAGSKLVEGLHDFFLFRGEVSTDQTVEPHASDGSESSELSRRNQ